MDRFVWCGQVRKSIFHKWHKVCEYIPFSDKTRIKELADKGMVLKKRIMPRIGP